MGNSILIGNRTIDRSRITGPSDESSRTESTSGANWTERIVLASASTLGVSLAFLLDPLFNLFA